MSEVEKLHWQRIRRVNNRTISRILFYQNLDVFKNNVVFKNNDVFKWLLEILPLLYLNSWSWQSMMYDLRHLQIEKRIESSLGVLANIVERVAEYNLQHHNKTSYSIVSSDPEEEEREQNEAKHAAKGGDVRYGF